MAKKKDDLDDLVEKAKVLAEATGREEADILADLMDDGILNDSHKETEKTDLVTQLKEAAELINTVQAINQEVSENKVLNGNGNSTKVEVDTTLEGDIVDRAFESVQRKAENIKKILILISPLFLLLGGGSLEMFGVTNLVGDDEINNEYDEKCDLWSIGVILYILLCGYPPFNGATDEQIIKNVKRGKFHTDEEEW